MVKTITKIQVTVHNLRSLSPWSYFADKSLKGVVADLYSAGSETLSTTLTWAILYIVAHEEVQERLQAEIDRVVGKSRAPSLSDKSLLVNISKV